MKWALKPRDSMATMPLAAGARYAAGAPQDFGLGVEKSAAGNILCCIALGAGEEKLWRFQISAIPSSLL